MVVAAVVVMMMMMISKEKGGIANSKYTPTNPLYQCGFGGGASLKPLILEVSCERIRRKENIHIYIDPPLFCSWVLIRMGVNRTATQSLPKALVRACLSNASFVLIYYYRISHPWSRLRDMIPHRNCMVVLSQSFFRVWCVFMSLLPFVFSLVVCP